MALRLFLQPTLLTVPSVAPLRALQRFSARLRLFKHAPLLEISEMSFALALRNFFQLCVLRTLLCVTFDLPSDTRGKLFVCYCHLAVDLISIPIQFSPSEDHSAWGESVYPNRKLKLLKNQIQKTNILINLLTIFAPTATAASTYEQSEMICTNEITHIGKVFIGTIKISQYIEAPSF